MFLTKLRGTGSKSGTPSKGMTLAGRQGEKDGRADDVNGRPHREQRRRSHRHAIRQFRGRRPTRRQRLLTGTGIAKSRFTFRAPPIRDSRIANPTIMIFLREPSITLPSHLSST